MRSGSFKQSGLGREGGTKGLHPYFETEVIVMEAHECGRIAGPRWKSSARICVLLPRNADRTGHHNARIQSCLATRPQGYGVMYPFTSSSAGRSLFPKRTVLKISCSNGFAR